MTAFILNIFSLSPTMILTRNTVQSSELENISESTNLIALFGVVVAFNVCIRGVTQLGYWL
jgi:hypothetical protein